MPDLSDEPCGVQLFIPPQLDIKAPYCGLQRGHAGNHVFRIPEDILSSPGIIEAAEAATPTEEQDDG